MKCRLLVGLFVLIAFCTSSIAQIRATNMAANSAPRRERPETVKPGKAETQLTSPIVTDYPNQVLSLTVEVREGLHCPSAIAARVFKETVHGLMREINSAQPMAMHLNLLLKIGGDQNYLEQVYGSDYDAVISLSVWNDAVFSRLLVRAVRSSILTDQQLDQVARAAVERARIRVDVTELKAR